MKILFVHLGREHLGLEMLSAVLKQHGHQTALAGNAALFSEHDNLIPVAPLARMLDQSEAVVRRVADERPDLVAFTAYSTNYAWTSEIARRVRPLTRSPIVFGGVHPTLTPERVLQDGVADIVVVGDGEGAILDLAEMAARGERRTDIPNTVCLERGRVKRNPLRPPEDLDGLPYADKSLFEDSAEIRDDYMIMTTRGCLYRCSYCCEAPLAGLYQERYFRRRSVDNVLAELRLARRRYHLRRVTFWDSVLVADRAWIREFLPRYRSEVGLPFKCMGHFHHLDLDLARSLRDAGCYGVEFGLQTFNEALRRELLNRRETNAQVERVLDDCDRAGLRYDLDLIFDLPGETPADHEAALRLAAGRPGLNRIKTFRLTYFPGTPILEHARERGLLDQAAVERIEGGQQPDDFFNRRAAKTGRSQRELQAFKVLYKVLPLLPARVVHWLLERQRYLALARSPGALTLLVQIAMAVVQRDQRFAIHLRRYCTGVWRRVRDSR